MFLPFPVLAVRIVSLVFTAWLIHWVNKHVFPRLFRLMDMNEKPLLFKTLTSGCLHWRSWKGVRVRVRVPVGGGAGGERDCTQGHGFTEKRYFKMNQPAPAMILLYIYTVSLDIVLTIKIHYLLTWLLGWDEERGRDHFSSQESVPWFLAILDKGLGTFLRAFSGVSRWVGASCSRFFGGKVSFRWLLRGDLPLVRSPSAFPSGLCPCWTPGALWRTLAGHGGGLHCPKEKGVTEPLCTASGRRLKYPVDALFLKEKKKLRWKSKKGNPGEVAGGTDWRRKAEITGYAGMRSGPARGRVLAAARKPALGRGSQPPCWAHAARWPGGHQGKVKFSLSQVFKVECIRLGKRKSYSVGESFESSKKREINQTTLLVVFCFSSEARGCISVLREFISHLVWF